MEDYGLEVCTECLGVSQHAGLKREVVESWPDLPEEFAENDEDMDEKEEVKPILKKTAGRKKRGRKKAQTEDEEDEELLEELAAFAQQPSQLRQSSKAASALPHQLSPSLFND